MPKEISICTIKDAEIEFMADFMKFASGWVKEHYPGNKAITRNNAQGDTELIVNITRKRSKSKKETPLFKGE